MTTRGLSVPHPSTCRHLPPRRAGAPSVLACEMAAALPQSRRHPVTDGGGHRRTYREAMFASVLVALSGQAEGRDALVLGGAAGRRPTRTMVVAHVMATSAAPLTGGTEAAARRRAPPARRRRGGLRRRSAPTRACAICRSRACPSPTRWRRSRAASDPTRSSSARTCSPASPVSRGCSPSAPCPVVVAPYGHRFVRAFAPARITVACGPPGPTDDAVALRLGARRACGAACGSSPTATKRSPRRWLAHAQGLAPAAAATRVAGAAPARWWPRRAGTSTCWSSPAATTRSCARPPARCWSSRSLARVAPQVAAQARR